MVWYCTSSTTKHMKMSRCSWNPLSRGQSLCSQPHRWVFLSSKLPPGVPSCPRSCRASQWATGSSRPRVGPNVRRSSPSGAPDSPARSKGCLRGKTGEWAKEASQSSIWNPPVISDLQENGASEFTFRTWGLLGKSICWTYFSPSGGKEHCCCGAAPSHQPRPMGSGDRSLVSSPLPSPRPSFK